MGYYTKYELSYTTPDDWSSEIEAFLLECKTKKIKLPAGFNAFDKSNFADLELELSKVLSSGYTLEEFVGGRCDTTKWYEHEKEMKDVSKKFPDVLFVLKGEGEESGDLWIKYFKDGKMQVANANIIYDDFDPGKLK
jgi:hypothetical protein